jgi:predicted dinucleotide-binding enzyme
MTTETPIDTIGIIGAGHAGQAFARVALRAGRKVRIANSRGPQSLGPVVEALGPGASAGPTGEAAAGAMVVIAVPWASVPTAVAGPA